MTQLMASVRWHFAPGKLPSNPIGSHQIIFQSHPFLRGERTVKLQGCFFQCFHTTVATSNHQLSHFVQQSSISSLKKFHPPSQKSSFTNLIPREDFFFSPTDARSQLSVTLPPNWNRLTYLITLDFRDQNLPPKRPLYLGKMITKNVA